ncbi:hypothetical protein ISS22_10515 [candidate division KSB1 bacterium]|nr:hypothetical protein [candidate division KSB1 bacterium]
MSSQRILATGYETRSCHKFALKIAELLIAACPPPARCFFSVVFLAEIM